MHVLLDLYGVLLDHEKTFRGYRERLAALLTERFGGTKDAWLRAHDEAFVTYTGRRTRRTGRPADTGTSWTSWTRAICSTCSSGSAWPNDRPILSPCHGNSSGRPSPASTRGSRMPGRRSSGCARPATACTSPRAGARRTTRRCEAPDSSP